MAASETNGSDGRRARRERSRNAVIDAVFSLVHDGKVPPSAESVAERASVSVSSIFRIFDGLDDMQSQAFEEFGRRYSHLFSVDVAEDEPLHRRIDHFVRRRIELNTAAGPLLAIARQRALDHEPMAERVALNRTRLAEQTRGCFAEEIRRLAPAEAANLVAQIDAIASPEAFELLGAAHARTPRQIASTWRRSIHALNTAWCEPTSSNNGGNP